MPRNTVLSGQKSPNTKHTEEIKFLLVSAIDQFQSQYGDVSALELLEAIEDLRFAVTEDWVKRFPETLWLMHGIGK